MVYVNSKDIIKYFNEININHISFDYPFFDINKNILKSFINVFLIYYRVFLISNKISGKTVFINGLSVDITFMYLVKKLSKNNTIIYFDEVDVRVSAVKVIPFKLVLLTYISRLLFSLELICKNVNGEVFLCVTDDFYKKHNIDIKVAKVPNIMKDIVEHETFYNHVLLLGYSILGDKRIFGLKNFEKILKEIIHSDQNIFIKFHPGGTGGDYFRTSLLNFDIDPSKIIPAHLPIECLSSNINLITSFGSSSLAELSHNGVKVVCVGKFAELYDRTLNDVFFDIIDDVALDIMFPIDMNDYLNIVQRSNI